MTTNVFIATAMDPRDDQEGRESLYLGDSHFSFHIPLYFNSIHPRTKLGVGYRLSRAGLAVAGGQIQIPFRGPIVRDSTAVINITYWSTFSSLLELENTHGFELCENIFISAAGLNAFVLRICCEVKDRCMSNRTAWIPVVANYNPMPPIKVKLAMPNDFLARIFHGLRCLCKELPFSSKKSSCLQYQRFQFTRSTLCYLSITTNLLEFLTYSFFVVHREQMSTKWLLIS